MQKIVDAFCIIFLSELAKYILFCLSLFLILRLLINKVSFPYFLHKKFKFFSKQTLSEVIYSVLTCSVYGVFYIIVSFISFPNSILVDTTSYISLIFWTMGILLYFDMFFYWSHRLLHTDFFIKYHRIHHRTIYTNPLASLSFHPVDVLIQNIGVILILIFFRFDSQAWLIFTIPVVVLNSYGHSGVDFGTGDWEKHKVLRLINKPRHHALHHMDGRFNFGLYLTFWDRVCRTFKDQGYAQAVDERWRVQSQNQKE